MPIPDRKTSGKEGIDNVSYLNGALTLTTKTANRCPQEMLLHTFGSSCEDGGGDRIEGHFFKAPISQH